VGCHSVWPQRRILYHSGDSSIAVWETANGHGPFIKHGSLQNAELLQVFLAVISITGMLLAAAVRERHEVEAALARE